MEYLLKGTSPVQKAKNYLEVVWNLICMKKGRTTFQSYIKFLTDSERVLWRKDKKFRKKLKFKIKCLQVFDVFVTTKCLLHNESVS